MSAPLSKKDRPLELGELAYRAHSDRAPPEFIFFLQGQETFPDKVLVQEDQSPTENHAHDSAGSYESQMRERIPPVDSNAIGSARETSRAEAVPMRFEAMGSSNHSDNRVAVKILRYAEDRGIFTLVGSGLKSWRLFPVIAAIITVVLIVGLASSFASRTSDPIEMASSNQKSNRRERTAEGPAQESFPTSPWQSAKVFGDQGGVALSEWQYGEKETFAAVEGGDSGLVSESDPSLSAPATQQSENTRDAATGLETTKMQHAEVKLESPLPSDRKLHATNASPPELRPDVMGSPSSRHPTASAYSDANAELIRRKKLTAIRARLLHERMIEWRNANRVAGVDGDEVASEAYEAASKNAKARMRKEIAALREDDLRKIEARWKSEELLRRRKLEPVSLLPNSDK